MSDLKRVTPETKTPTWTKPRLEQGREGFRRKVKPVTSLQPSKQVQIMAKPDKQKSDTISKAQATVGSTTTIQHIQVIQTVPQQLLKPKMLTKEVLPCPDLRQRPPHRPPDLKENQRTLLNSDINSDFEENFPYQEGIISESYQRPDKSYVQEPPEFGDLLDMSKLFQECQNIQI